jgi:signal transduction histidine kinase
MTKLEEQACFQAGPEAGALATDLGDTIFGVVHDLGNLIQVASSALNIVSRNPDMDMESPVGTTIASARVSLQKAGTLVQQTMRFARNGNATVELVDVWACLVEIETLVTATWDSNIRLEIYAGRELPPVICSRVSLQSAVMNLLLNAREAMSDGGVISLVVTAIREDHIATGLELRCSDTGFGMSEDVLRRASEPYFTTKTSGLGGLGLPMVKRFAEEVGGRLYLESEPGRGTTATLRLPIPTGRGTTIDLRG